MSTPEVDTQVVNNVCVCVCVCVWGGGRGGGGGREGGAVVSLVECSGIGRAFWDGIGETEQLLKVMDEQFTVCMCVCVCGEGGRGGVYSDTLFK